MALASNGGLLAWLRTGAVGHQLTVTNDGYVPNRFNLNDFYVAVPDLPYVGTAKFGYFQPSMGLQMLTSSWDIGLMEPAAPLQAIVPGDSPGMSLGRHWGGSEGT